MSKFYRRSDKGPGYLSNREMFVVPRHDIDFWRSLIEVGSLGFFVEAEGGDGVKLRADKDTWFNGLTYFFDLSRYMRSAFWHDLAVQEGKGDLNDLLQSDAGQKAANRLFKQIALDDGKNAIAITMFIAIKTHTRWFK